MKTRLFFVCLMVAATAWGEDAATLAKEAWASGDHAVAIAELDRLAADPKAEAKRRADAIFLGSILRVQSGDPGQIDAAITRLAEAAALDESRKDEALCLQGDAKLLLQRPEEALAIYRAVGQRGAREPWLTRARLGVGIALLVLGEAKESREHLGELAREMNLPAPVRVEAASRAVKAAMLGGDVESARVLTLLALKLAGKSGDPVAIGWVEEAVLLLPTAPESLPALDQAGRLNGRRQEEINRKAESIRLTGLVW